MLRVTKLCLTALRFLLLIHHTTATICCDSIIGKPIAPESEDPPCVQCTEEKEEPIIIPSTNPRAPRHPVVRLSKDSRTIYYSETTQDPKTKSPAVDESFVDKHLAAFKAGAIWIDLPEV
ncbi:Fc.00g023420.m01.CDS01 [Cosmosporella sp. VM-42]